MGKDGKEEAVDKEKEDRTEDFVLRPQEDRGTHGKDAAAERKANRKAQKQIEKRRVSVARFSVGANLALLIVKIIFGIVMGSVSVISEGIHSGMDLLAAAIALVAVGRSMRPADEDHHYGHGKYEPISGTIEAVLIFIAAALIISEAVIKIIDRSPVELIETGIMVMLLSVVLNALVTRSLMKVAKETESLALEADALHHLTDVWTSAGVLAGLIVIRITGFYWLDPIVAIGVSLLIIKTAWDLTRKTVEDLSDKKIPEAEEKAIKAILDSHDHVIHDYHHLRTRRSGQDRYIDLHIVVSRDLGLVETHRITDHLEAEIKKAIPHAHTLIHMEPCDGHCEHCDEHAVCAELRKETLEKAKKRHVETGGDALSEPEREKVKEGILKVLEDFDEVVSYHRLEARREEGKLKLSLHVLVRAEMTVERSHELDHALADGLNDMHPGVEVLAHMEPCNSECEDCKIEDCPEREYGKPS